MDILTKHVQHTFIKGAFVTIGIFLNKVKDGVVFFPVNQNGRLELKVRAESTAPFYVDVLDFVQMISACSSDIVLHEMVLRIAHISCLSTYVRNEFS